MTENGLPCLSEESTSITPAFVVQSIRCVLEAGANAEAVNKQGDTPLMVACQHGSLLFVQCLLEETTEKNWNGCISTNYLLYEITYEG